MSALKRLAWKELLSNIALALLVCFSVIVLVPPTSVWDYYTALSSNIDFYLRLSLAVFACIYFIVCLWKEKGIDLFLLCYLLFSLTLVLPTLLFSGDLKQAIWGNTVVPFTMILLVSFFVRKNPAVMVRTLFMVLFLMVLYNLYTVLQHPGGGVESTLYFFGNRNSHICYYLPLLFTGHIGVKKRYIPFPPLYYLSFAVCCYTVYKVGGLTTTVILILWGVFMVCSLSKSFKGLPAVFGIKSNLAIFLIIQGYTVLQDKWLIGWLSVVKKTLSFSERTKIWLKAWEQIKVSPLIGYGYRDMWGVVGIAHPHCPYLHILINRGLIGFLFFILLLVLLYQAAGKIKNRQIRATMLFFLFCVLLANQVDECHVTYYALYATLVYYLSIDEIQKERLLSHKKAQSVGESVQTQDQFLIAG